jgi:hypothetical protein
MAKLRNKWQYFKYMIRDKMPNFIWNILANGIKRRRARQFSEKSTKFCKHPQSDEHLFIIRRRPPGAGLFSNVSHVLQGIIRAENLGLTPYVDMENYWTWYSRPYKLAHSNNAWEYFFKQPEHAKNQKQTSCILSSGDRIIKNSPLSMRSPEYMIDKKFISSMESVVSRVCLNESSKDLLHSVKELIGWEPQSTLGIFYRGGDYLEKRPSGHAIQPDIEKFIDAVDQKYKNHEFSRIFLATNHNDLSSKLHSRYPSHIYFDFKESKSFRKILQYLIPGYRIEDLEMTHAFGYLIQTFLFSEVKSCVSTVASGSAFSFLLNQNKYLDPCILYEGTYP